MREMGTVATGGMGCVWLVAVVAMLYTVWVAQWAGIQARAAALTTMALDILHIL